MSSQQKSLLIDSPTSPDNAVVGSLAGAKRTLAHDAPEGSAVIGTNDATATAKFASVAADEGAENANENANIDGDVIDTVRVHKKSKHVDVAAAADAAPVDVEAEKDAFVQQSTQLKHDALEIKEQTEATLDKLNEVHYELVKNTNALLSAVDPNLNAAIKDVDDRIKAVEEAAAIEQFKKPEGAEPKAQDDEQPVEAAADVPAVPTATVEATTTE